MPDAVEYMLTTIDNPYNPFEDYDAWSAFDISRGYHTSSFLARIAMIPDDLPEPYASLGIQEAIDEVVHENVLGLWRKVSRESFK